MTDMTPHEHFETSTTAVIEPVSNSGPKVSSRLVSRLLGVNVPVKQGLVSPTSPEAVLAIIEACIAEQCPLRYGETPLADQSALTLDMSVLRDVIRFRPEEQLITVHTGIRIAEIERVLRTERLQLPFLFPATNTLLSALNTHPSSLVVHRHPHLAHWVTGIEAITGDGRLVHYGGDVVKNVTGHDLTRLLIGSNGQFGVITAATLRVIPQPMFQRLSVWHFDSVNDALHFIRQSRLLELPCIDSVLLLRLRNVFGMKFLLRFAGTEADVTRCIQYLQQHYQNVKRVSIPTDFVDADVLWEWAEKLDWVDDAHSAADPHWLIAQAALPQSALTTIESLGDSTVRALQETDWVWNGLTNTWITRWSTRANFPEATFFKSFRREIEAAEGRVSVLATPGNHASADAAGMMLTSARKAPEKRWLNRLQQQLNPHHVLPLCRDNTP